MPITEPGARKWWDRHKRRIRAKPPEDLILTSISDTRWQHLRMMTPAAWRNTDEYRLMRENVLIWNGWDPRQEPERTKGLNLHHRNYAQSHGRERYGDFFVIRGDLHVYIHKAG